MNTKTKIKSVQLVEEEREVLKYVSKIPKEKVVENLVRYKFGEPNSDHFFLVGSNF